MQLTSCFRAAILAGGAMAILCGAPTLASAQWLSIRSPNIPRLPDGKPNLTAPAPRTPDGKPDLSGIWMPARPYFINIATDLKPGEVPFRPWGEELYKHRRSNESKEDPTGNCIPGGVPRADAVPYPFKIVRSEKMIIILYEAVHSYRQIFTDGRELPKDPNPTWMGYSVGHWDGDTLVAETAGFKDQAWLDNDGHPGSDALHVIERFHRKDLGHTDIQITIDDPKAYTRPWTVTLPLKLMADTELLEYVCNENNRDLQHLVGK
ncbi:MAG: hypothetical protein JOZ32_02075 [Bryobacterales bacterium]|nr:hypothetical protein [Bryobacterales bacterium]